MIIRQCKHDYCNERARFRIETCGEEDEDVDYPLNEWSYSCNTHLKHICDNLSFRDQSCDAIIDLETGYFYVSVKGALEQKDSYGKTSLRTLEIALSESDNKSILF